MVYGFELNMSLHMNSIKEQSKCIHLYTKKGFDHCIAFINTLYSLFIAYDTNCACSKMIKSRKSFKKKKSF